MWVEKLKNDGTSQISYHWKLYSPQFNMCGTCSYLILGDQGRAVTGHSLFLIYFFMLQQLSRDSLPPNMLSNMMLPNK